MRILFLVITSALLLSINLLSYAAYPELISLDQPWSVVASVGNGRYTNMHPQDGNTPLARLALDNDLIITGDFALGLELGLQNGNHLQLPIGSTSLTIPSWFPVRTALNPMLDLLITAKSDPLAGSSFFAQLKGGLAYRYWRIDKDEINDISQLAGEIQAGLGFPISALASLNVLYQIVYGRNPDLHLNLYHQSGHLAGIPSLHAILLGLSINL